MLRKRAWRGNHKNIHAIRLTPKQIACPLESAEGIRLKNWADYHPLIKGRLVHNKNEGKTSWQNGKSLKAQGVRAGYPDYHLPFPRKGHHGLYIELKRINKKISTVQPEQQEWLDWLNSMGFVAVTCWGADEAIKTIEEYLK